MTTRELTRPPRLAGRYAKAALGALPLVRRLRSDPASGADNLTLSLADLEIRPERLAEYRRICCFGAGSAVPATYPHLLAFPLQLALMTDRTFPFAALGLVHIGNRIDHTRPLSLGDRLDVTVQACDQRPHPRGHQVTLVSRARVDSEVVWTEEMVLLSRHHAPSIKTPPASGATTDVPLRPPKTSVDWRLPPNLGRSYAAVSGDRNPIHLYDVTAKAFGFRTHIAHGMWTMARALAELETRLPASYAVHVVFKKPVALPGAVGFGSAEREGMIDFGVTSGGGDTTHMLGRVVPGRTG
ncbi:MAG: MaoC/PaaZ C-terminal domain-containing protein [Nocardioidaceae bacterium]